MRRNNKCAAIGVDGRLEFLMVDRHWIGDLARAILLALPLAMLARPAAATINNLSSHHGVQIAASHAAPSTARISLLG